MKTMWLFIIVNAIMVTSVVSYDFNWHFSENLTDTFNGTNNHCDGNITYWKTFLDNAKLEHPSANLRDLIKYISQDIMKNSGQNPIYSYAKFLKANPQDFDESYYVFYQEFYGNWKEFIAFPYNFYKIERCDLGNFTLGMLKPNETLWNSLRKLKFKNNFFKKWLKSKNISLQNRVVKTLLAKNFVAMEDKENCTKLPKVQKIIDKLGNMQLSTQNWTRSCIEEFKFELKSNYSGVLKALNHSPLDKISFILEGEGKLKEMFYCFKNPDTPRCKNCQIENSSEVIIIKYLAD